MRRDEVKVVGIVVEAVSSSPALRIRALDTAGVAIAAAFGWVDAGVSSRV